MLAQTGVKSDIYRCIQCLTDKSWEVRSSAADALGAIRSEAAKKALLARLQIDKHYIVRRDIASSLAFYDLSAVPVLRHRLTVERNPIARLALLFTLYVHGDSDQLEPYLAYLDDSDFIVRNNACNNICVDLVKDRDVDKIVERLKRRMAIEDSPGVADDIEGVVERFQKKTSS
jgi:HEAT repeat protein